ncbi:MAG: QueT transporter family protein [Bacilli bacterium]
MNIKDLVRQAVIAALYVTLTLVVMPISYGQIQFRISEILILLAFYDRRNCIGLIVGCLIANMFSPMLIYDITLGVAATAISVLLISYSKHLFVSIAYPVIFNGLIVGLELYLAFDLPYWISAGWVALGEVSVLIVGAIIFKLLEKNKTFMELIVPIKDNYE